MLHRIESTQFIKSDIDTVWHFISSPGNLARITPAYMGFSIINSPADQEEMYAGQIIEYTITPLLGLKLHWVTEITHVEDRSYFVDEQRFGPYALWHHQHFIKAVNGGVEMRDLVHYKLPAGLFGRLVNRLFVARQLREIFAFRHKTIDELYHPDL